MALSPNGEVTQLLLDASQGQAAALEQLLPLVYGELQKLARHYMRSERANHTLETAALINEAYLRLVDQDVSWANRAHFFGLAARLMRQILIDHARAHNVGKRGGNLQQVSLTEAMQQIGGRAGDLLALDEALDSLAKLSPEQARVVELRFFGGLTIEETAEVMGLSHATIERYWTVARAYLRREMSG